MSGSPAGRSNAVLSRRRFVTGVGAIGLVGAAASCTPDPAPGPPPAPSPTVTRDPDAGRRRALTESAGALAGSYSATISTHPTLASALVPLRDDHLAHLVAVDPESAASAPSPSATGSGATTPAAPDSGPSPGPTTAAPPRVPPDPVLAQAALEEAEVAAAEVARADAVTASDPALARLLASIAASRVLHATILRAGG